jgi:hypothetical protein
MFASKTLVEHLLRGLSGAGAITLGVVALGAQPWLAALAFGAALLALRGCPTCWTVGLFQTLAGRRGPGGAACADNRCGVRSRPGPEPQ